MAVYPGAAVVGPISCKRWRCPTCGPRNARILKRRLSNLDTNRFVTLTYKLGPDETPQEAATNIKAAWVKLHKRILRRLNQTDVKYVLVIEWTQLNSPHLHCLLKSSFLPQRWLSRNWRECSGAPIVDVRRIRSAASAAAYLAKYLSKTADGVPRIHRYSASHGFLPPKLPHTYEPDDEIPLWAYYPQAPSHTIDRLTRAGWTAHELGPDQTLLLPPPPNPQPSLPAP